MNEYAIYLKLDNYEIDAFLHFNDLSYTGLPEEVSKNYKVKDKRKGVRNKKRPPKSSCWS